MRLKFNKDCVLEHDVDNYRKTVDKFCIIWRFKIKFCFYMNPAMDYQGLSKTAFVTLPKGDSDDLNETYFLFLPSYIRL